MSKNAPRGTGQPDEKAPVLKLQSKRFKVLENEIQQFAVFPSQDTPYEALFKLEYWAHISDRLRPFSRLEIYPEDMSYRATLEVAACEPGWAKVYQIWHMDLSGVDKEFEVTGPDGMGVEYAGPYHKWRVIRLSDKEVLSKGHDTRGQAEGSRAGLRKAFGK